MIPKFTSLLKALLRLKLNFVQFFNIVDQLMRSGRLKLNSGKTECILVTGNTSMRRNFYIHSVMVDNIAVQLYIRVGNLGFVFEN